MWGAWDCASCEIVDDVALSMIFIPASTGQPRNLAQTSLLTGQLTIK